MKKITTLLILTVIFISGLFAQSKIPFETYDDEAYNYDPYTPKKLHKLRMQRNGIVHSEKCNEKLTLEEIKWCIDYICKMG